jgi:sugar lactone lactonase YvrE
VPIGDLGTAKRQKEYAVPELKPLLTGLVFGESPRWHDNRLWCVDMGAHEVIALDLEGNSEVIVRVPTGLSAIDWLPDGRMLIAPWSGRHLLRQEPDGSLVTHTDLTSLSEYAWNDMVVDGRGNAYIGNLGWNFPNGEFHPGILALVTAAGAARQVADDLYFPNGMVVTPDNSTLIIAELRGGRLTAFDIHPDGSLSNRRVWADLAGAIPDGICLDAENAIWYASLGPGKGPVRVREGGQVVQGIDDIEGGACFACMLGGTDGRTLFLMVNRAPDITHWGKSDAPRTGRVLTMEAPAAAAGWPRN